MQWKFKFKKELITFEPKSKLSINDNLRLQAVLDGLRIAWVAYMIAVDAIHSGQLDCTRYGYALKQLFRQP